MKIRLIEFNPDEVIEALKEYAQKKGMEFDANANLAIQEVGDDGTIVIGCQLPRVQDPRLERK